MNKQSFKNIHTVDVVSSLAVLEVSKNKGLTSDQVADRQQQFGQNIIQEKATSNLFLDIIKQLRNPLAIILIVAFFLTLFLGEYIDAGVILLATVINVTIALFQERRAGDAFKALARKRSHDAVVVRDGAEQVVDAQTLVPGDIVHLTAGQYVPADGQIIHDNRLSVNQVMFTGESKHIKKNHTRSEEFHVFDRHNMVYMGSTVMTGNAVMLVTATAFDTQFGKIADKLGSIEKTLSPVQNSMRTIARFLGIATLAALVVIISVGLIQGESLYAIVILAVAVGVSAVPEGLLSAVTVVLAYGARQTMRAGGLVKNLASAETLGSATMILTDKTGTLTFGRMKVGEFFSLDSDDQLAQYLAYATDVFYDAKTGHYVGDEMDTAIANRIFLNQDEFNAFNKAHTTSDTIPFDSAYKFYATKRGQTIAVKGAPEVIIDAVETVMVEGQRHNLTGQQRSEFKEFLETETTTGKRLLAFAVKTDTDDTFIFDGDTPQIPTGLTLLGLVTFYDQVRQSVPEVIAGMRSSKTHVIMITGDNPQTAHYIALESGIISDPKEPVYVGTDVDRMTDDHLYEIIKSGSARVFARVTPDHKLRMATVLQERGEIVAMTGDGVNDAPALQKATIGISLASATEVAKEAADLVLVNNSFSTIAYAIQEGRRIVANLRKTIVYLLSTSFSIVFVLLGSMVIGGPTPFYATQVLWANILEEGLMNFAFIFEPNHDEDDSERGTAIFSRKIKTMVVSIGLMNGTLMFAFYMGLLWSGMSDEMIRTYMFAILSVGNILFAVALKSLHKPIWRVNLFSNVYLIVSAVLSFVLLYVTLTVPFLRTILHLEPVAITDLGIVFLYGVVNVMFVEIVKKLCR